MTDTVIKSSSNPHADLPSDMKMFGQLLVNGYILKQTVPIESAIDQNSWTLTFGCEVWVARLGTDSDD
jgi:hypothetical protein